MIDPAVANAAKLRIAKREMARIDEEIRELERQRYHHAEDARKAQLLLDGIEPCHQCGRAVPSPCHTADNFHESGPWDYSCRDSFYPELIP